MVPQEMNRDQLFLAAKKGDIATIKILLKVKSIDVNIKATHDFRESQVILVYNYVL